MLAWLYLSSWDGGACFIGLLGCCIRLLSRYFRKVAVLSIGCGERLVSNSLVRFSRWFGSSSSETSCFWQKRRNPSWSFRVFTVLNSASTLLSWYWHSSAKSRLVSKQLANCSRNKIQRHGIPKENISVFIASTGMYPLLLFQTSGAFQGAVQDTVMARSALVYIVEYPKSATCGTMIPSSKSISSTFWGLTSPCIMPQLMVRFDSSQCKA